MDEKLPEKMADETLDELRAGDLRVFQKQHGYRFSLDPVLLCGFARFSDERVVFDLGSGNGVIPLLVAASSGAERIVGVERQSAMVERSRRSVELNGLCRRIEICQSDIQSLNQRFQPQCADLVMTNPPFRVQTSGRIAPDDERAAARHELAGGLQDFLRAAAWLLKNGGRFHIVYLPERLAELLAVMREVNIEPKRLRCVHSREGEPARLVLVEGRRAAKPGGLQVEPPLYIYAGESYTPEVLGFYGGLEEGR